MKYNKSCWVCSGDASENGTGCDFCSNVACDNCLDSCLAGFSIKYGGSLCFNPDPDIGDTRDKMICPQCFDKKYRTDPLIRAYVINTRLSISERERRIGFKKIWVEALMNVEILYQESQLKVNKIDPVCQNGSDIDIIKRATQERANDFVSACKTLESQLKTQQ